MAGNVIYYNNFFKELVKDVIIFSIGLGAGFGTGVYSTLKYTEKVESQIKQQYIPKSELESIIQKYGENKNEK